MMGEYKEVQELHHVSVLLISRRNILLQPLNTGKQLKIRKKIQTALGYDRIAYLCIGYLCIESVYKLR